jgi:hypothetical protein
VVTRLKAQIQTAKPGQVLEVSRFAVATLAKRSPELYAQFLAGLGHVAPPPVKVEEDGKAERALIVADRKARWKALCEADEEVRYWQASQEALKAAHGANCVVDDLIAEDPSSDIRKYLRGKKRREELLKTAGLARVGSTLVPLTEEGDDSDSQLEERSPMRAVAQPTPVELQQFIKLLKLATAATPEASSSGSTGTSSGNGSSPSSATQKTAAKPPPERKDQGGVK